MGSISLPADNNNKSILRDFSDMTWVADAVEIHNRPYSKIVPHDSWLQ